MHQSGWTEMRLWAFHFNVSVNEALTTNLNLRGHPTCSNFRMLVLQPGATAIERLGLKVDWLQYIAVQFVQLGPVLWSNCTTKLNQISIFSNILQHYINDCLGIVAKSEASSAALSSATNLMPSFLIDLMIQTIMLVQHLPAWDKLRRAELPWRNLIRLDPDKLVI